MQKRSPAVVAGNLLGAAADAVARNMTCQWSAAVNEALEQARAVARETVEEGRVKLALGEYQAAAVLARRVINWSKVVRRNLAAARLLHNHSPAAPISIAVLLRRKTPLPTRYIRTRRAN